MVSANVPRQHGRRRDETRLIETARKTKDMFSWMLGSSNKFAQQICANRTTWKAADTTNWSKPDRRAGCACRSPCVSQGRRRRGIGRPSRRGPRPCSSWTAL